MDNETMNNFKFLLTQGNVVLYEKIFNGNDFSLHTRGHVDIRKVLPESINTLQRVLSKNNYTTKISVDSDKMVNQTLVKGKYYDLFAEYLKDINSFPANIAQELEYKPESLTFKVDAVTPTGTQKMTIRGVECKISFSRNDSPIVERLFYVDRFNPIARWSVDLTTACDIISNTIIQTIKNRDVSYLWSEYDKLFETTDLLVIE